MADEKEKKEEPKKVVPKEHTNVINFLVKQKKIDTGDTMRLSTHTESLKVQLDDQQVLEAADQLTRALDLIVAIEEEKKETVANFTAKTKAAEGEALGLTNRGRNKWDYAKIDCVQAMDNTKGCVIEVRLDTMAVTSERAMNAEERQSKFYWPDEDKENK